MSVEMRLGLPRTRIAGFVEPNGARSFPSWRSAFFLLRAVVAEVVAFLALGAVAVAFSSNVVAAPGDLAIALTATPDPVEPGQLVFYTLTFSNRTGAPVGNITVTASVPDHVSVAAGRRSGGVCSTGTGTCLPGGVITWAGISLAAGQSQSVSYVALVDYGGYAPANGTLLTSQATVTAPGLGVTAATGTAQVQAAPAASVELVVESDPVAAGALLRYALTVSNRGAATTPAGALSLSMPTGTTFVSASGGGSVVSGATQWAVGSLPAGAALRYELVLQVDAGALAGDLLTGTADFVAGGGSLARATIAKVVALPPMPVELALVATPDPVKPGEWVFYTLTFSNRTAGTLSNLVLTATVPDHTYVRWRSGGGCSTNTQGDCSAGGTLSWSGISLPAGQSQSVSFAAVVDSGGSAPDNGTLLSSQATVTAPGLGVAVAKSVVLVDAAPAASLELVADSDPVVPGEQARYTLTVANRGAATTVAGMLTMAVPTGTTFVSASGGGSLVGGTVQWNIASLAAGAALRYELVLQVDAGAVAGDLLTATADFVAGGSSLARASMVTMVTASPVPMDVVLASSPDPVKPGEMVFYTLTFSNRTALVLSNVTATASVPNHTSVGWRSGGACSHSNQQSDCYPGSTITWAGINLAAGQSQSVSFTAQVDYGGYAPANGTQLRSVATVTAPGLGVATTSNVVLAHAAPVASLELVEGTNPAVAGSQVRYVLTVANRGAATIGTGLLTMAVPISTTFVSASGGGSLVSGAVQWNVGSLAAGAALRYELVFQVAADAVAGDLLTGMANFVVGGRSLARAAVATMLAPHPVPMAVALAATPDPVKPGELVLYTLTFSNRSPDVLSNVAATVSVPNHTSVGWRSGGICSYSTGDCGPSGTITWSGIDLAAGESQSVSFKALVDSGGSAPISGTLLSNQAAVTAPGLGVAAASHALVVHASPVASLELVEDADSVLPGALLRYTLSLGNRGAVAIPVGMLSMAVPAGSTFVSASGGGSLVGGVVQWNVGSLAPGAGGRYQLAVQLDLGAVSGDLISGAADFVASGSSLARATAVTMVAPNPVPMELTLTAAPDPVLPGASSTFTLTFKNRTAGLLSNVEVTASVPNHASVAAGSRSGGVCSSSLGWCYAGSVISWPGINLTAGESQSVSFTAAVDFGGYAPPYGTQLSTQATMTAPGLGVAAVGRSVFVGSGPIFGASPPTLNAVASRKTHGAAGTFDLALNSAGTNPATEPRQGPAHLLVFTFDKAVTGGAAAVSEGTATVGTPTFSGNEMRVPLSGVGNQQYVTVTVSNVIAADGGTGGSGAIRVGFLAGDVNQSRVVTLADLGQVNAQVAQAVTGSNYLKDVNASGTLSLADKGLTNQQLTKALPAP